MAPGNIFTPPVIRESEMALLGRLHPVLVHFPIALVIRSADTNHGFAIKQLKIDVDIPRAGR